MKSSPPFCLVLAVCFRRATTGRPYKNNKTLSLSVGAIIDRPQRCSLYLSAVAIKKGGYEIHPYIYGLFVALPFYAVFLTYTHSLKAVVLSKYIIKILKNHTYYCFLIYQLSLDSSYLVSRKEPTRPMAKSTAPITMSSHGTELFTQLT